MQLTPEQALLLLHTSLPTLEREHQTTVRLLEAVPADKADYRPDPVRIHDRIPGAIKPWWVVM